MFYGRQHNGFVKIPLWICAGWLGYFLSLKGKSRLLRLCNHIKRADARAGGKSGNNVVIGAGSIVTKDVPDNVIAYGNPCRVVRENK